MMSVRRRLPKVLLVVALSLTACASRLKGLQSATAGQVGCPPNDILITERESSFGTSAWTAQCHGRSFECSSINSMSPQVSCREAEDRLPNGQAVPAGTRALVLPLLDAPSKERMSTTGSGNKTLSALRAALTRQRVDVQQATSVELSAAFDEARRAQSTYLFRAKLEAWTEYRMRSNQVAIAIEIYDVGTASLLAKIADQLEGDETASAAELVGPLCDKLARRLVTDPRVVAASSQLSPPTPPSSASTPVASAAPAQPTTPPSVDATIPRCVPGVQVECPCLGGAKGVQVCAEDGRRYAPCQCAQTSPPTGKDGGR